MSRKDIRRRLVGVDRIKQASERTDGVVLECSQSDFLAGEMKVFAFLENGRDNTV